jgi:hypothetical protein
MNCDLGSLLVVVVGLVGCSGSDPARSGPPGSSSSGGSAASSSGSGSGSGGPGDASVVADAANQPDGSTHQGTDSGSATEGGSSGDGGLSPILVPAQGALLGEYYGNGTIAQTVTMIGRTPLLDLNYFNWASDDWTTDPTVAADFAAGRVPLVNWEPYDNSASGMVSFDDIVAGKYDSYIQKYAAAAKGFDKTFFLDFAAEMNSDEAWTNHDAAKYIAGWRHVHDIFTAAGATNVVWAWCPNVTDSDGTNNATMTYYPGDTYVDWVGVDGYNWGTSQPGFGWQTFQQVFQDIYPLLAAVGKPVLIGEMASDEVGGSKAQWIDDIVPTLKSSFPMIKAFVWFDVKKERDWEINSSPSALTSYQHMAIDPFMNP